MICQQQKTLIPTVQFLSLISRICNAGVKTGTKPTADVDFTSDQVNRKHPSSVKQMAYTACLVSQIIDQ